MRARLTTGMCRLIFTGQQIGVEVWRSIAALQDYRPHVHTKYAGGTFSQPREKGGEKWSGKKLPE
jgi:hypothetical protein